MSAPRSIPISRPSFSDEEWQAVRETLESGWIIQGPRVKAFEEAFARRHRVQHAVAASSGTTALHLALQALDVGPGDEVIVPAFTWVATANAVLYAGATPVFVDVCEGTYNIDCAQIPAALNSRTRAVIPVHLFGLCADMRSLGSVVPAEVRVIEDAACAAGAACHGTPAGAQGHVACFSFHPRKSITTGEGGMILTADPAVARRIRQLRNHGLREAEPGALPPPRTQLAEVDVLGFNYRLTDVQAAIGLVQLAKLDQFIVERAEWACWYARELADIPWLRMPDRPDHYDHAWQSFVVVVAEDAPLLRDDLMARLQEKGIATRPGTHAIPELAYYRARFGFRRDQFPVASRLLARSMAIPLHNRMTPDDYRYVVEALHAF